MQSKVGYHHTCLVPFLPFGILTLTDCESLTSRNANVILTYFTLFIFYRKQDDGNFAPENVT
jgi:hypothetical protein